MNRNTNVYQVSQLSEEMRRLMETSYPEIWIEGELSSLSAPVSGHLYFSLKDERSQLRCAMFKGRAGISRYRPKIGDLVRVRAKISVYTARGDLQCIVQHMEEAGEGVLQRRFEELKEKLNNEGLFQQSHKQPLPSFPKHIGIVSSPTGAAVRDIISALKRRCPGIPVTIYPAIVQGDSASNSIISAIRDAVQHQACDILLLSRGGGSLEDLWCFNHEDVAREIHRCPIPVVSGVGHEVDVTISDLVADLRAPTPTAAAELVSPDRDQLYSQVASLQFRLPRSLERLLQTKSQQVDMLAKQLVHPRHQLKINMNKVAQLSSRLNRTMTQDLQRRTQQSSNQAIRLKSLNPKKLVQRNKLMANALAQRMDRATSSHVLSTRKKIENLGSQLHLVSPLATLDRGFAIAKDEQETILRSSNQSQAKDQIKVTLSEGTLKCEVLEVIK